MQGYKLLSLCASFPAASVSVPFSKADRRPLTGRAIGLIAEFCNNSLSW